MAAKTKTLAERAAFLQERAVAVCEARGHGGLWPSKQNCVVCALAELVGDQDQKIRALDERLNDALMDF